MTTTSISCILKDSIGYTLGITQRKLSQLFTKLLIPYEITPEQWVVLFCVVEDEGQIQKTIAERSSKDKPSITRILDMLEDKSLITKQDCPLDRRSYRIYSTTKGRSLIESTRFIEHNMNADATAGITPDEYKQLVYLLERISDNVNRIGSNPTGQQECSGE